jgi:hypothetical protein
MPQIELRLLSEGKWILTGGPFVRICDHDSTLILLYLESQETIFITA